MRSESLPVVAIGKDAEGRPLRLSIPIKPARPIPVISEGIRVGQVAVDGAVSWTGPGVERNFDLFAAHVHAVKQVAWHRKKLLASIIDDKVVAVVVPPTRKTGR